MKIVTPIELADYLRLDRPNIYSWARRNNIPRLDDGNFDLDEVLKYLKETYEDKTT